MQVELSDEQLEFQKSLQRMIADRSPIRSVREIVKTEAGWDEGLWQQFAEQAGLPAVLVPEKYDGAGATPVPAMIVMEELGRGIIASPFFATTAFGVVPILTFDSETQKQELLPSIAAGEVTLTTALTEPSRNWGPDGLEMVAVGSGETATLSGTKSFVIDGHTADKIIVVAKSGDQYGLYIVGSDTSGLTRMKQSTPDLTRPVATLELDSVSATAPGEPGSRDRISHVLDGAATLRAAELVVAMEASMTIAVEYATVRNQFNRAIGSFPGIKHCLSEMAVELDTARAAAWYTAYVAAGGQDEFPTVALAVKAPAAAGFASPRPGRCRSTAVSVSPGITTHSCITARSSPSNCCSVRRRTPGWNWRTDSESDRRPAWRSSAENRVTTRNRGIAWRRYWMY